MVYVVTRFCQVSVTHSTRKR